MMRYHGPAANMPETPAGRMLRVATTVQAYGACWVAGLIALAMLAAVIGAVPGSL